MSAAQLQEIFVQLLSPNNEARRQAEAYVQFLEGQPGFLLPVLQFIADAGSAASARQSAAVLFKNVVKRRWSPSEDSDLTAIAESDRDAVRQHLVDLMCSVPKDIQKQLAEAVSIIAKYDFPERWGTLLPQLVSKLAAQDLYITKGVMLTVNSITKRYRFAHKSDALFSEILICLEQFQVPLLETFKQVSLQVDALAGDKERLLIVMETMRLMSRIFFSLNWQDIPAFFEDHIAEWMTEFSKFIGYSNALLVDGSEDNEAGPVESLQAAIIENLNLYVSKYEEEFSPYLGPFTQAIWQLLLQVGSQCKYDNLATCAIKFLTSVSSKHMNMALFTDQVLKDIVEHIVIRNVSASAQDEELFEDNPTDYIRKDIEGSDQDTRRRCAIDLVRSLLKFFPVQVSRLCTDYIAAMLEQYRVSMAWQAKDAALHLVIAVAVMSSSATLGAGDINPNINLMDIFSAHVLPEIGDADVNARPIVKADAIKMICLFRNNLPGPFLVSLLPSIINHLSSEHVVIQTYAAMCIERFLSVKDRDEATGSTTNRITKEHLAAHLQALYSGLFSVLDNEEQAENDYVMKCIMRTLVLVGSDIVPILPAILPRLTAALERVCKSPLNPQFNHYLFECLAIVIKSASASASPEVTLAACSQLEQLFFPPFQSILAQDVVEFIPYVFQILAVLLSARPLASGLSAPYQMLFPLLLAPVLWERRGNVPALTILFRAYIRTGMAEVISGGHLQGVLGVFQKLLSAKATEQYAFELIDCIFTYNSLAVLTPYLSTIWNLLLLRMQFHMKDNKTHKYCRFFIHTAGLFSTVHGGRALFDALEGLSGGLTGVIVNQVWELNRAECLYLPNVDQQQLLVGGAKLLTETPVSDDPAVWGSLYHSLVAVALKVSTMSASTSSAASLAQFRLHADDEEEENREFDSTYSKLTHASISEPPVSGDLSNAPAFFFSSLTQLFTTRPGAAYAPIMKAAEPTTLASTVELMHRSNQIELARLLL